MPGPPRSSKMVLMIIALRSLYRLTGPPLFRYGLGLYRAAVAVHVFAGDPDRGRFARPPAHQRHGGSWKLDDGPERDGAPLCHRRKLRPISRLWRLRRKKGMLRRNMISPGCIWRSSSLYDAPSDHFLEQVLQVDVESVRPGPDKCAVGSGDFHLNGDGVPINPALRPSFTALRPKKGTWMPSEDRMALRAWTGSGLERRRSLPALLATPFEADPL